MLLSRDYLETFRIYLSGSYLRGWDKDPEVGKIGAKEKQPKTEKDGSWKYRLWLMKSDFQKADLRACNLANCNLSGANLSGANLKGANLKGTNLRGANLGESMFWEADLNPKGSKYKQVLIRKGTVVPIIVVKPLPWLGTQVK